MFGANTALAPVTGPTSTDPSLTLNLDPMYAPGAHPYGTNILLAAMNAIKPTVTTKPLTFNLFGTQPSAPSSYNPTGGPIDPSVAMQQPVSSTPSWLTTPVIIGAVAVVAMGGMYLLMRGKKATPNRRRHRR